MLWVMCFFGTRSCWGCGSAAGTVQITQGRAVAGRGERASAPMDRRDPSGCQLGEGQCAEDESVFGFLAGGVALVGVARPLGWVLLLEVYRVAARMWTRWIGLAFGMLALSLLALLSLMWRAVTPWDLLPAPADPKHPIGLSPYALSGGCANRESPAYHADAVVVDRVLTRYGAQQEERHLLHQRLRIPGVALLG